MGECDGETRLRDMVRMMVFTVYRTWRLDLWVRKDGFYVYMGE